MRLPHGRRQPALPAAIELTPAAVAVAVGRGLPVLLPQQHQGDAGTAQLVMDVRPFRLGLASRAALGARAGIQHRLQHSLTQRRRQRPAKLRRGKAIEGHGHRAARNPQRSGNRSVRRTAFVLEAQDLSYASHRHSLGWHRSPRSSFLRRAESRAPPSGRAIATPQGWPTSFRNGRDQIGTGGRLHSGISGRLHPEYAGFSTAYPGPDANGSSPRSVKVWLQAVISKAKRCDRVALGRGRV